MLFIVFIVLFQMLYAFENYEIIIIGEINKDISLDVFNLTEYDEPFIIDNMSYEVFEIKIIKISEYYDILYDVYEIDMIEIIGD